MKGDDVYFITNERNDFVMTVGHVSRTEAETRLARERPFRHRQDAVLVSCKRRVPQYWSDTGRRTSEGPTRPRR